MRLFLLLCLCSAALSGCSDACQNTVVNRATAPDGQHTVVMFQRDCGATTGFSTQVSVVGDSEQADDSGNAFRADDNHGAATVGEWGGPWAEARWIAADHLLIRYAPKSRIFHQAGQIGGVKITYEAKAP